MKKVFEVGSEYDWDSNIPYQMENGDSPFKSIASKNIVYLRSGRDALRYIAQIYKGTHAKVVMPTLCCSSMVTPFETENYTMSFYKLKSDLSADMDDVASKLTDNCIFVFTNYFGERMVTALNLSQIRELRQGIVIVEDITHDFMGRQPLTENVDFAVCSIRKWFAIPDGGILIGKDTIPQILMSEDSFFAQKRSSALQRKSRYLSTARAEEKVLFRRELEEANIYLNGDNKLAEMSGLSKKILASINFKGIYKNRRRNAQYLEEKLRDVTGLRLLVKDASVSTIYFPILVVGDQLSIERHLSEQGVYAPVIWPLPEQSKGVCPVADEIGEHMLAIPCDHRYNLEDMEKIVAILKNVMKQVT